MLRLEFPNESHSKMYEDMIVEWSKEDDFHDTSPWALFAWSNFQDFLKITRKISKWEDTEKTKSTLFFLVDDKQIIWWIDLRNNIKKPTLRDFGWHIGYWVRPSERKKWYATKMLQLWLVEAKKIWINKVLVSCHPDNLASEKVIIQNGGVYDTTMKLDTWVYSWIYKRYWITL